MKMLDLAGQRFGRLVAVALSDRRVCNSLMWECVCDCGGTVVTLANSLRMGRTQSCGCLRREIAPRNALLSPGPVTHGKSGTPTYSVWKAMVRRGTGKGTVEDRELYAGISVCERWRESFENFLADMGEKPDGMSIDRRDNSRGYEPGNCRWATATEQANNKRPRRSRIEVKRARELVAAQMKAS